MSAGVSDRDRNIDRGYAWAVLFAVFMNHVIVDGIMFSFGIFKIQFTDYFMEGEARTTLVGSISSAICLLSAPIASVLVNRFDCRTVAMAGSLIASAGFVGCRFCNSLNGLMISYGIVAGIGLGFLYLPSVVAVSFYFDKRRALATGIAVCGSGVGSFVFAPLGDLMLRNFDWKNSMFLMACITLQGCVFGAMLRPMKVPPKPAAATNATDGPVDLPSLMKNTYGVESANAEAVSTLERARRRISQDSGRSGHSARGSLGGGDRGGEEGLRSRRTSASVYPIQPGSSATDLHASRGGLAPAAAEPAPEQVQSKCQKVMRVSGLYLLKEPFFLIPWLCNLVASVGLFVPFYYVPSKAMGHGVEQTMAAFLLSIIGIANTLGRIFAGFLADFEHVSALLLHNFGLLGGGLLCILSAFATNYVTLCIFCVCFGVCYASWMALTSIVLCEMLGLDKLTHAFGLLTMARGAATLVGPPLAGAVYDATKDYNNAMHVGGIALLCGGLICCLLHLPYFQTHKDSGTPDCAFCCPYPKSSKRQPTGPSPLGDVPEHDAVV